MYNDKKMQVWNQLDISWNIRSYQATRSVCSQNAPTFKIKLCIGEQYIFSIIFCSVIQYFEAKVNTYSDHIIILKKLIRIKNLIHFDNTVLKFKTF